MESRSDSNRLRFSNAVCTCSCSGDVPTITADNFEKNVQEIWILEEVRKNIPKLFVNLVLLGNI